MMFLAKQFDFSEKWTEIIKRYTNKTPLTKKNYEQVYFSRAPCFTTIPEGSNLNMGMVEGMQRASAVIQALLDSPIDDSTSRVNGAGQFKWTTFQEVGVINEVPSSAAKGGKFKQNVQDYFGHSRSGQ